MYKTRSRSMKSKFWNDGGGAHEVPHLAEELLATDGLWKTDKERGGERERE